MAKFTACQITVVELTIMLPGMLPPLEDLLSMEPEELAPIVLKYLETQPNINRYNFSLHSHEMVQHFGRQVDDVYKILMETWMWLEVNGFLAPKPGTQDGWAFVTRKGKTIVSAQDFSSYQKGNLLPPGGLDPILVTKVRPTFIRGDYETAIFQAFREVEVRVRAKGGFAETDIGVALMRDAFKIKTGPLTDKTAPVAEQEAKQHLFAGAIGFLKNPTSHRVVSYTDPNQAADLIRFANQLLKLI